MQVLNKFLFLRNRTTPASFTIYHVQFCSDDLIAICNRTGVGSKNTETEGICYTGNTDALLDPFYICNPFRKWGNNAAFLKYQ